MEEWKSERLGEREGFGQGSLGGELREEVQALGGFVLGQLVHRVVADDLIQKSSQEMKQTEQPIH